MLGAPQFFGKLRGTVPNARFPRTRGKRYASGRVDPIDVPRLLANRFSKSRRAFTLNRRRATTRRITEAAGVKEVTVSGSSARRRAAARSDPTRVLRPNGHAFRTPRPRPEAARPAGWAHHRSIAAKRVIIRRPAEERPTLAPKACEGGMAAFADGVRYLRAARERQMIGAGGSIEAAAVMLINESSSAHIARAISCPQCVSAPWKSRSHRSSGDLRGLGATEAA